MIPDCDVTTFEAWRLKADEDFAAASILAGRGASSFPRKMRLEAVKKSPASGRGRRNRLPHL
jgi:hypothetical protein